MWSVSQLNPVLTTLNTVKGIVVVILIICPKLEVDTF